MVLGKTHLVRIVQMLLNSLDLSLVPSSRSDEEHFSVLFQRLKEYVFENQILKNQVLNNNSKYLYVLTINQVLANANLLNPYNNPQIQPLLLPLYRWRNWCIERLGNFLNGTQLTSDKDGSLGPGSLDPRGLIFPTLHP